ncbi:MAG: SRPBCC family protein [Halobacteriaceae archaeon]
MTRDTTGSIHTLRWDRRGGRPAVSVTVAAEPSRAWRVLRDTTQWPAWGPSVSDVETSDRYVGPGTVGRVQTPVGWLRFRVTSCADRRWAWRIGGLPGTGHSVRTVADTTVVQIDVPAVAIGYLPVCARGLRRLAVLVDRPSEAAGQPENDGAEDCDEGRQSGRKDASE